MKITERIDSIYIAKGPDKIYNRGNSDRVSIWANEPGVTYPIAYIHKPKGISQEDWDIIKEKLQITLLK